MSFNDFARKGVKVYMPAELDTKRGMKDLVQVPRTLGYAVLSGDIKRASNPRFRSDLE